MQPLSSTPCAQGARRLRGGALVTRVERAQLVAEVSGDRTHARHAGGTLGVAVVVGVRVDVVRVELARVIDDELDAGDADAVVG